MENHKERERRGTERSDLSESVGGGGSGGSGGSGGKEREKDGEIVTFRDEEN